MTKNMTMTVEQSIVATPDEDPEFQPLPLPFWNRPSVRLVLPWSVFIIGFLFWEAAVALFAIPEYVLPAPSAIFASFFTYSDLILENAWITLVNTLLGFGLAVIIGGFGGVMLGAFPLFYDSFYPSLIAFNSIPKVALVPILVIWFGVGAAPAIISAFLISFFPILVNVATGIATIEPDLRDVLRVLGADKRQIILKVGLPRSMPYFFASIKVAMTLAFVGSIIAETVAGNAGIGQLMLTASARFQVPLTFAGLLVTGVMGVGLYVVASFFEMRMTRWASRGNSDGAFSAG